MNIGSQAFVDVDKPIENSPYPTSPPASSFDGVPFNESHIPNFPDGACSIFGIGGDAKKQSEIDARREDLLRMLSPSHDRADAYNGRIARTLQEEASILIAQAEALEACQQGFVNEDDLDKAERLRAEAQERLSESGKRTKLSNQHYRARVKADIELIELERKIQSQK